MLVRLARRATGIALGCMLVTSWVVSGAMAQGSGAQERYPSKPIRLVVPFAVGGATDIVARIMAARMSDILGQQIVVENRAGAGGNLGSDLVAKAAPDGYTLLIATVSTHAINSGLYKKMPYDPVTDFEAIGKIGVTPLVLVVHKSVPVTDVKGLVALLKANPGKYSYGSSGMGSAIHLCVEVFKTMAGGLDVEHVPYRGSGPMMNDLAAGQIPMSIDGTPTVLPQVEAGTIRALASGTATRARVLPDLPTMQEAGFPGFECYTWNALFAPAGTPAPIIGKLNKAMNEALADKAVFARLQDVGMDPTPGGTPADLTAFVKAQLAYWMPIAKASGAVID